MECSFLLAFALAELEEARKNFAECHSVFSALLAQTLQNLDAAKLAASTEVASALSSLNESFGSQAVLDPSDIDTADLKREQDEKRRSVESSARQKHATEISELDKAVALVWIMHMRFARRSEVRQLSLARQLYARPDIDQHRFQRASNPVVVFSQRPASLASSLGRSLRPLVSSSS